MLDKEKATHLYSLFYHANQAYPIYRYSRSDQQHMQIMSLAITYWSKGRLILQGQEAKKNVAQ